MSSPGFRPPASERGVALITVLLLSSLVFTIAVGLALVVAVNSLAVRNHREALALSWAARGGIELAARAMAAADWSAVLAGRLQAPGADGPPTGTRRLESGQLIDLATLTNFLTCGRPSPCADDQLRAVTLDRPWGTNNPRWRLFLHGPFSTLASFRFAPEAYILVWVGDDGRETDGDPATDGGGAGGAGLGVLRVHALALGRGGGRRAFEAELVRICRPGPAYAACQPGIRVQSWRDLRQSVP